MKGDQILELALEKVSELLTFKLIHMRHDEAGLLKMHAEIRRKPMTFRVVVKTEIRQFHLNELDALNGRNDNFLLVIYRLYPKLRAQLRERGVNYLAANGNVFIQNRENFIYIDREETMPPLRTTGNRAFTKTGLKVLFQLLLDSTLINQTQREIAKRADVGLGNIPGMIQGLKEAGYLLKQKKNTYQLTEKEELVEKWANDYTLTLKPTLMMGSYTIAGDRNWQELELKEDLTLWGGEAAGNLLTGHLRPGFLTLYTRQNRNDLIKDYKLVPDQDGEIEVVKMFWKPLDILKSTVPPLLAYADLVNAKDERCVETAKMIFDEYIKPRL